ncbi:kinase-like protein [Hypoxylon sp. NC1633]|nr:kinase-like protein [Hypoxylon sp. NC1633]
MAAPLYDEVLRDLHNQIHEKLERRDDPELRFAKVGTTRAVLLPVNLRAFFRSVVPPGASAEELFGSDITTEVLVSRIADRNLHGFLATLIYARCSIESAKDFIKTLLVCDPDEWQSGDQFPVDREQLKQIFVTDNGPDVNGFIDAQPCFCPVVLLEGEDVQLSGRKQRLPYLSDPEHVGTGAYGDVYRVEIAEGHLLSRRASWANTTPKLMARKDFKKSDDFQKESGIMKQILYTPRKSEYIVETFGTLQMDEATFSLFMPYAKCDLGVWMRENPAPSSNLAKSDIFKCASGLADGLVFLHSEIKDHNHNRMVCYHMDLKPANILVFPDDREHGRLIWKISDFGMSRVKVVHDSSDTDKDLGALFQKREDDLTVSATFNRRFDGTYLAPESRISMRNMNEKSDVWSLGCVGQGGIDEYSETRANVSKRSGAGDSDRFFLLPIDFALTKPHPSVRTWHTRLVNMARQRSSKEANVISQVLDGIGDKILQLDPGRRGSAEFVRDALHKASIAYQGFSDNHRLDDDLSLEGESSLWSRWIRRYFRRPRVDLPKVHKWLLSDARAFIGCSIAPSISPSKALIAYWTDTCISLYSPQSFRPHNGKPINRVAESYPNGVDLWKSVKLTQRFLIATTRGRHPYMHLFDLEGGELSWPNFTVRYEVILPIDSLDGLHQIAISPGGQVVACVAPQDSGRAWVYYADLETLLRHRIRVGDGETSSIRYRISQKGPWRRFSVNASARNVTHLLFPSDTTLCSVAQPEIAQEHNIQISYLSLDTRHVKTLPVSASPDFDSGNVGRLFTTLTTINNEGTFAAVLYENQLLVKSFQETNGILDCQTFFRNYRIVELLMDDRGSRLIALGVKSGNETMSLVELPLSHLGHKPSPREIRELPNLRYGDSLTARLVKSHTSLEQGAGEPGRPSTTRGGADNGYIIISVYAIGQPTLYRINLPRPT